ncbi:DsbA family protein [Blastochloris sulfoviridis]|uniref:DsbA family protein n=1 Tax=Blastochloris sulfoviridis TaxID=50712 RepID=A0A5M6I4R0_9HYPH|nr:DsbA family protein [Blastochloris sulfoviridis]KAA5603210.1 DsbA family protein [Blastochloris sulfoviridis]
MTPTRRTVLAAGLAALAPLALAPLAGAPFSGPAGAESFDAAELLVPGPLPEKVLGKANAPVTMIEYSSLTCSHCAHFHADVYPKLKSDYIDTGKVRLILREFPLDPVSAAGYMLARCAGDDKYFPLIEALFATQKGWAFTKTPYNSLLQFAKQAGFSQESFETCLKNQQVLSGMEAVRKRGSEKFGINSTPTFFINGEKHVGAMSFEELAKILDPLVR